MAPPNFSSGFNLIESAIVLGVVGLVIGGIWIAAATVSEKLRINTITTDSAVLVESLMRNLSRMPAPAGNGSTDLSPYIQASSFLPPTWTPANQGLTYGNKIDVYAIITQAGSAQPGTITVSFFNGMTPKLCHALAQKLNRLRPNCTNIAYGSSIDGGTINLDVSSGDLDGTYMIDACNEPTQCFEQGDKTIEFRATFKP